MTTSAGQGAAASSSTSAGHGEGSGEATSQAVAVSAAEGGEASQEGEKADPVKKAEAPKKTEKAEGVETTTEEGEKAEGEKPKEKAEPESKESEEVKTLKEKLERFKKSSERVAEVLTKYPEVRSFIIDLDKGASPLEAIARNFDLDALKPMDGDPDYEAWDKAKKEYSERKKKDSEYEKLLSQNREFTQKEYNEFAKEYNLTDDEAKQFVETITEMVSNINSLKIDKKIFGMVRAAMTKDRDVETARKQGEISAKNEKIVTKRQTESANRQGDGLPGLAGGSDADASDLSDALDHPLIKSVNKFTKRQRF